MLTFKTPAPNRPSPLSTFSLGLIGVPLLALGALAVPESASAGQFTTLYNFAGGSNDGCSPSSPLILDAYGVLHGETLFGDSSNNGTVFATLAAFADDSVLHSFQGADGQGPSGGLIYDSAGNLYGTTEDGGSLSNANGTVFKLAPDGTLTTLHNFTGSDGAIPLGALVADSAGNLYGTTSVGGSYGYGTVFKLAPDGSTFTTLYSFTGGNDGSSPSSDLVFDPAGNLYGTAAGGGAFGYGTVFELTTGGQLLTKHAFQDQGDGDYPTGGLVFDRAGNLYGTAFGDYSGGNSDGNVFELAPNGTFTVLYSFQGGSDGNGPFTDLIFDSAGNLYGTTIAAGASGFGTVFRLSPNGNGKLTSFEVVPTPSTIGVLNGLVLDQFGTLYGTSAVGGGTSADCGTVYEISSAAAAGPTLTASPASLTFQPTNFTANGYGVSYHTVTISVKGGNYIPKTPLLTGPNADQFAIKYNYCNLIIPSGGSCTITLGYFRNAKEPAGEDSTAILNLTGDATLAISLTGEE